MSIFSKIKDGISKFANNITHPILVNFVVSEMKANDMSFEELQTKLYEELEKNEALKNNKKLKSKAKKRIDKLLKKVKEKLNKEK